MKTVKLTDIHSGYQIQINPDFIIALVQKDKNGQKSVYIYTSVPDLHFEVLGDLAHVNKKLAEV